MLFACDKIVHDIDIDLQYECNEVRVLYNRNIDILCYNIVGRNYQHCMQTLF
eukprot:jgi/Psemu1/315391/fgenesh1_kg.2088_\